MTIRLGRRLLDVLRGLIEPLSLMLEDDLLHRCYAENRNQDRAYQQAGRFVRLAAHKNPRLRILEIGAGTGYVSPWQMFSRVYCDARVDDPNSDFTFLLNLEFSLQITYSEADSNQSDRSATSWILNVLGHLDWLL